MDALSCLTPANLAVGTITQLLAEASPLDRVWGIGLRADHPAAKRQATWRGQNLLGKVLQEVRMRMVMDALNSTS